MAFERIYKMLELEGKGGFVSLPSPDWPKQVNLPERLLRLVTDATSPLSELSALFCFGGKPLIFFFEDPTDESALHKTIWNLNEIPVVVVGSDNTVKVYNGFAYEKELKHLQLLGGEDVLCDFSYFKIVTGQGWEEYRERLGYHNRVDYFLLKNIQYAQEKIQAASVKRNLANRLIGKIIFLRYLTDRNVMLRFEGKTCTLTNQDIIELLQDKGRLSKLFEALQDSQTGFNGDLFKITSEELESIPDEALNVLVRLLRCDDLESGEMSLFDVYDFSILPIEFISNVYERFIGRENQEKQGAYYTPLFLVDYIVEKTVGEHLKNTIDSSCKILDPACGSGIFLVESLRRIIDHYLAHASKDELVGEKYQNKLKELAKENIFGIDSDESAVQVAAFSVYLTLLDYQDPADISSFRFPNMLENNLICRDTFLETPFAGIEFDYIIGNPPWKRGSKEVDATGKGIEQEYQRYVKCKERQEGRQIVNNQEIAQAFVVRTFDFMRPNTKCALVLTSKILYNIQSHSFRSYLLEKAQIASVLELSSVRHEVFTQSSDPATAPACVIIYSLKPEGKDNPNHLVEHTALKPSVFFSLFKVLAAEKKDIQLVRQSLLKEKDYLWKVLLYGSYLDFLFVSRLKNYQSIADKIKQENYSIGQGIICGADANKKHDASQYCGQSKVNPKNVKQFFVVPSDDLWKVSNVQRKRKPELFKAPLLLVKKSTSSTDYTARASLFTEDAVYTDALTGIHGDNKNVLRNIAGVLNSSLFPYYALMCMSSIAVEREQAHNEEKFLMPYVDGDLYKHVERIEKSYALLTEDPLLHREEESKIEKQRQEIENCIAKELHLSDIERLLLEYANNYSIPIATGKNKGSLVRNNKAGKDLLSRYIRVFIERFSGQFGQGLFLNVECAIDSSYVLIRFKVEQENKMPVFSKGSLDGLTRFLLSLTTSNISENLYLRKDLRGFEKDGFYIVKPAEERLWHPAIAYVDVQEFADSIIEQGIKREEV